MINFDVWDRLGYVWAIFDTAGLLELIFHCHICEDFVSKWAYWSVCKAFTSKSLTKALQTLKSAHFDTKSSQIWPWKIDYNSPTVSKMAQTCPNRSQTSKSIIRNRFWSSITCTEVASKKLLETPHLKRIPLYTSNTTHLTFYRVFVSYVAYICYVEGCKFSTSTHESYRIV